MGVLLTNCTKAVTSRIEFRRWLLGLVVALFSGVLTGFVAILVGATLKMCWGLAIGNAAKDALLFLAKHPADSVSFGDSDPAAFRQTNNQPAKTP